MSKAGIIKGWKNSGSGLNDELDLMISIKKVIENSNN
jgi:hypothetical protein